MPAYYKVFLPHYNLIFLRLDIADVIYHIGWNKTEYKKTTLPNILKIQETFVIELTPCFTQTVCNKLRAIYS